MQTHTKIQETWECEHCAHVYPYNGNDHSSRNAPTIVEIDNEDLWLCASCAKATK
mgnify:CR=1 FL=1